MIPAISANLILSFSNRVRYTYDLKLKVEMLHAKSKKKVTDFSLLRLRDILKEYEGFGIIQWNWWNALCSEGYIKINTNDLIFFYKAGNFISLRFICRNIGINISSLDLLPK